MWFKYVATVWELAHVASSQGVYCSTAEALEGKTKYSEAGSRRREGKGLSSSSIFSSSEPSAFMEKREWGKCQEF